MFQIKGGGKHEGLQLHVAQNLVHSQLNLNLSKPEITLT